MPLSSLTSVLIGLYFVCATQGTAEQLPNIPGHIETLTHTSKLVYEPHALKRSRYAPDGPDAFILVDASSIKLMKNRVEKNYTVTLLAGYPLIENYKDGDALDAEFHHISDFAQSEDGKQIYISDQDNHCIRLFDREFNNVTVFAGNCTEKGGNTGPAIDARFAYPSGLVMSKDFSILYIADHQNNRILRTLLDRNESWVQTVVDSAMDISQQVVLPVSLTLSSNDEYMYITTENGVVSLTNFSSSDDTPVKSQITQQVKDGLDIVVTNNDQYLVIADLKGNRLVFHDLINGGSAQFCSGRLDHPGNRTDGDSSSCEMYTPQGLAVLDDNRLFVTEHRSRVIRELTYRFEDLTTTTTEEPTTTTPPSTISTASPPTQKEVKTSPSTTEGYFGPEVSDHADIIRPKVEESESDGDKKRLAVGLSVGITVPVVLIGLLGGFIFYVFNERRKAENAAMYTRRTEQGGYAGPGGASPGYAGPGGNYPDQRYHAANNAFSNRNSQHYPTEY